MDIYDLIYPLEWVVANIMVLWHQFLVLLGLPSTSGAAWSLSIVGLTVTIRIILIPLFVRQIKASRAMQMIAPELKAVQEKYKGKKDQASREAMSRETMELYSKHKTNPFSSCLPMLAQAPVFFALFRVLNVRLKEDGEPIGLLTETLRVQASEATIFGAKLSETFMTAPDFHAKVVAGVLIVIMVATSFLTQRQLTRKNMPKSALEGPMARQQQLIMYAMPFVFIISGPYFPIGVLIYWTTSNLWTGGQQYYVIKRNPTPGSEAERVYLERKTEKAARKGLTIEGTPISDVIEEVKPTGQRQQPKRKDRNKGSMKPVTPGIEMADNFPQDDADMPSEGPDDASDGTGGATKSTS